MKPASAIVGWLALAMLASACEIVAGIDERKPASKAGGHDTGAGGYRGGGGMPATGGKPGGGAPGAGGTQAGGGGQAGGATSAGGSPGSDAPTVAGGAGGSGGIPVRGGATSAGGSEAVGGAPSSGGSSSPGGSTGSGGSSHVGGATGSGGVRTGGSSGSGGVKTDAAVDAPPYPDAAVCPGLSGSGRGLLGEYFGTTALAPPRLTRLDATVDFNWPAGPEWNMPADRFSVRWSGQVEPRYSGKYTFYTNVDDGARLWVNGVLLIDDWNAHDTTESSGSMDLVAGQRYSIKLEYFEQDGSANVQLAWSSMCQAREIIPASQLYAPVATCGTPSLGTGTGITGQYFDDAALANLRVTRLDPAVAFTWPAGVSPHPSIPSTRFSVRWTGQVVAKYTDWTTLFVTSDGGVRLFVDDVLVVDNWTDHPPTRDAATLSTTAGQAYNLRLEYVQQDGAGQVELAWGSPCQPKETIPRVQLSPTYVDMVCSDPAVGAGIGLRGDYFGNQTLTGAAVTHAAEVVNFDWADGAPAQGVGVDDFSVRWSGQILARSTGATTFRTLSDDGVRLWVAGQLVIDNWGDHQVVEDVGAVKLVAAHRYDIKLEFRDNAEKAVIKLLWSTPCHAPEVVPGSHLYPPGYPGPDAGPDVGPDIGPDLAPDGGPDVGPDAPADREPAIDADLTLDSGVDGA